MSIDGLSNDDDAPHYDGPAGGWGSVKSMARIMGEERPSAAVLETLRRQNKPGGFMCVSCAWAKVAHRASVAVSTKATGLRMVEISRGDGRARAAAQGVDGRTVLGTQSIDLINHCPEIP